jgi:uncharacterized membrane protein YgcG
MKKFVLLTALTILSLFAVAQKASVKGKIVDSITNTPMESATIVLYNLIDSSVFATTASNKNGVFEIKNVPVGGFRLYITSVQFSSTTRDFVLEPNIILKDVGNINILQGKKLEDVTVVGINPVRLAQDTVEYKADAFKTRPNAMVEDLLKRLPGVQVDKDGKITAQGQTVTKVLVDGKEFFGNDPKTATKNLPANIVDKVQVIDKKSDQSQFTGFDDGTTEKVINVTIKKDKKKGYFGRVMAGGGNNGRYESSLSLNRFNNGRQLSIIGQANNINQEGFTFQDIMDFNGNGGFGGGMMGGGNDGGGSGGGGGAAISMTRGSGGMFGGISFGGQPSGLKTTRAGGINFADQLSKKLTLSSSYFYNNGYTLNESSSNRQTNALDTTFSNINSQNTISRNWNTNHRLNLNLDWNIDSFNSVLIRPNITYVERKSVSNSNSNIVGLSKIPKNQIDQKTTSNTAQLNFSGSVLWRHKTRVKGRTFSIRLNGGANTTDGDGTNFNEQKVFLGGVPVSLITDQITQTDNSSNTFNTRATYTEPLSKTRILELYYSLGQNNNSSDRKAFKKGSSGNYNTLDSSFSNVFENKFQNQQVGFNIQTKLKKYDYNLGAAVQKADLTSINVLRNTVLTQKNIYNFFPTARLNFNLGKSRSLRFNYRGNTNQPSASQLQPVVDNSNQLNIRNGNPALRQEFTNNLNLSYNKFDFIKLKSIFTFFNFSTTSNKIVDSIVNFKPGIQSALGLPPSVAFSPGAQYRKPINANGTYNVIGNVSFGFPIKAIKTTNFNTGSSFIYNRNVNVTDGKNNFTNLLSFTQNASINHNYKDKLDIMLSASAAYNNTKNTLNSFNNTKYYSFNNSLDVSYTFKNDFTIQSDVDNNIYTGRGAGFDQNYFMWNGSVSKLFLKSKSLEAKFTAFDILKQNRAINRTVQDNFIEDSRNNVLTQYFMLTLKYNISKFGGKGAKGFSMPKIPGMRGMNNMRIGM